MTGDRRAAAAAVHPADRGRRGRPARLPRARRGRRPRRARGADRRLPRPRAAAPVRPRGVRDLARAARRRGRRALARRRQRRVAGAAAAAAPPRAAAAGRGRRRARRGARRERRPAGKVARYYHGMERARCPPTASATACSRPSRGIVGASAQELREAGRAAAAPPRAASRAPRSPASAPPTRSTRAPRSSCAAARTDRRAARRDRRSVHERLESRRMRDVEERAEQVLAQNARLHLGRRDAARAGRGHRRLRLRAARARRRGHARRARRAAARAPASRCRGCCCPARGEIWVNAEEARQWPPRRRFTIGHELGHWEMHRTGQESLFCRRTSVDEAPGAGRARHRGGGERVRGRAADAAVAVRARARAPRRRRRGALRGVRDVEPGDRASESRHCSEG